MNDLKTRLILRLKEDLDDMAQGVLDPWMSATFRAEAAKLAEIYDKECDEVYPKE